MFIHRVFVPIFATCKNQGFPTVTVMPKGGFIMLFGALSLYEIYASQVLNRQLDEPPLLTVTYYPAKANRKQSYTD